MKHPQTTKTRAWKKLINETADKEYKKALQLNKLCGAVENLSSDQNTQACRDLLSSKPKIPEILLLECALNACKQHNYKALQIMCEYDNETLPLKLLVKARQNNLDVETIQRLHLIMRNDRKYSLLSFIKHVKDGKDLEALLYSFDADYQFDLRDYLESVNHLVINHIQNSYLLLDASVKLAQCDDVLVPACRLDYPDIVRFIMETGHYTASTLDRAIQVTIKYDNAHVLEIFIENNAVDNRKKIFRSCCEQSAKTCIDMILKKEKNRSYLQFEKNDNVGSTLDAVIQTTLENDDSVIFELMLENKSDEDAKDIFLRCCEQSAKTCIEILLKKQYRAYLQHNIGDLLKGLCEKNSAKIIETIITTCTCIRLDKKVYQCILSAACSNNWQCIIEKLKDTYKFNGTDIVKAVKRACKNNYGHLIHCLMSGIKFTPKQRSTMIHHAVKYGLYADAATIIQHETEVEWDELRNLSIPTELTESFTNFMHKVIRSKNTHTKYWRSQYSNKKQYEYIKRVFEQFPDIGGSTQAVDMFRVICKDEYGTPECSYCLRHLLNKYTELFDNKVIMTGLRYAVENKIARTFMALTEFYVKEYNIEDIKPYVNEMFLILCTNSSFILLEHEGDKFLELITKLFNLPDDTAMECVNNNMYMNKNSHQDSDPEPWTCARLPTSHTLLLVLRHALRSITRLICSKWDIDDQTIEDIVNRRCDESDVWKILLDRFPTEITDDMKFNILFYCVTGYGRYRKIGISSLGWINISNRNDDDKIFRAVLSTDKQRTNEEVCTLLSACDEYMSRADCVTPLLKTYKNLPLRDVLRVMNHLLTDKDRPHVVYKITEVYAEYHDVYRAMINEMHSKLGFNKHAPDCHSSKSVMAEVVKKYTDIYAHNTSSSHDSMKSESVMEL